MKPKKPKRKAQRRRKKYTKAAIMIPTHGEFAPSAAKQRIGTIEVPIFAVVENGKLRNEAGCPMIFGPLDRDDVLLLLNKAAAECAVHAADGTVECSDAPAPVPEYLA